jgi:hypothetical protein
MDLNTTADAKRNEPVQFCRFKPQDDWRGADLFHPQQWRSNAKSWTRNLEGSVFKVSRNQGAYSQHIFFFTTFGWAQQARMLHNIRLQRLSYVKRCKLSVQFVSYEEKEVLWIRSRWTFSVIFQHYKAAPTLGPNCIKITFVIYVFS